MQSGCKPHLRSYELNQGFSVKSNVASYGADLPSMILARLRFLLKRRNNMKYLIFCFALVASSLTFAGDIDIGKAGATVCAGCHGMDGKSVAPGFPSLAGQDLTYLKNQLKNFRDKTRTGGQSAIMFGMASGLSDDDIDNLATYFSSLNP